MRNSIIRKLQLLVSALAVVIIALLSFTPILTVSLESNLNIYENSLDTVIETALEKELEELYEDSELSSEKKEIAIEKLMNKYKDMIYEIAGVNEDGDENIDTELSLSALDIAKSVPDLVMLLQYWVKAIAIDSAYELANSSPEPNKEAEERYIVLKEELASEIDPEAVNINSVRVFRLFLNGFLSSVNVTDMDDETPFKIITVSLLIVFKLGILIAVFVLFPVAMAFSLAGLVFSLISKKRYNKILKKCKKTIVWMSTLLLAVAVCGAELTEAGTFMLLGAAAAIVVNLLASRFKSYTKREKKFLNVMQLSAIVSAVGIAVFALFLAKADLLSFYTSSKLAEQVSSGQKTKEEITTALAILAGMGALTIAVLQRVFKRTIKLVTRAACMGGGGGSGFVTAAAGALLIVVNNYVLDMFDISLSLVKREALNTAFIGAALALAGAIIFKLLGAVFAHGTTREEKRAVMSGTSINEKSED